MTPMRSPERLTAGASLDRNDGGSTCHDQRTERPHRHREGYVKRQSRGSGTTHYRTLDIDDDVESRKDTTMPLAPVTTELMKHLPAALRPNPHAIDDHVMKAVENGWTPAKLAEASYSKDRNPTPAFVVTNIRHLCELSPAHQTGSNNQTGPCQLGCDHGWFDSVDGHSVVPCRSCRPDTYRRVSERTAAIARGAGNVEIERIMIQGASTTPIPHTYPVSTP